MNARKVILDALRAQRGAPLAWGENDCLCFAADCATPLIGRDPVAHLRGRYDSEQSARELMTLNGWADLADVAASLFAEIPVAQARAGDWATLANPDGSDALGVVAGESVITRGPAGHGYVPLLQALRAFRVAA